MLETALAASIGLRNNPDKEELIQFSEGDRIWILPDKQSGTVNGYESIENLPDDYWWVGEIVNCCYLPNGPADSQDANPVGFLEVAVSHMLTCH